MINDFGATEVNTVLHTALRPTLHISAEGRGYRPIANVSAFILDDSLRLVPFGVHGELCIAGASVALSYLNLPDVTAERFVTAQPTGSGLAMRLYRTGEMGYMTPDGGFHITGRRDHQVKVNGMRVELGEVEEVLRRHPAVAECAVIDRLAFHHHRVLHAYVVPRADRVIELSDLQMYLRKRLLPYMVPVHIEWLDALPRRPNGKLDRAALRDRAPLSIPAEAHADTAADTIASIIRIVREAAAAVLGVGPESVDTYREFRALGLDSVASVDFANYLATKLHRPLSPIKLFEYPTIARLTDYLVRTTPLDANRSDWTALGEGQDTPASPQGTDSSTDIAIIGMSGRFPGADDIGKFWDNLRAGAENIGTIAPDRWDPASIYDPDPARERRSYSKWGGFLADVAEFDPLFFGLSPAEARAMDPQQRLCLMESWHALEDACYTGIGLDEQTVGVFVGARESDYPTLIARAGWAPDANTMLGNDLALLAARISYFCDLRGPSLVVDTACSSALVALHLACRSLLDGECTMALAGGVCVTDDPDFYVATSKLSIFSPTGHCRAFDEGADGFVHGEGVGFVVLKPLRRAIADNDHIYAVIRGTAINQDGRSNGITAPNGEAQTTLQAALYRRLTINPETISYVEAHGTGTRLGDPVEVQALTRSFRQFTQRRQYCALGSVKTNIGHLTAAAGIASLIKAILCLYHRELVPSLHFSHPNALIEFEESPFYVSTRCCAWETLPGQVRRAAVNSFGIGGTNVHCVLEEAPAPNPVGVLDEPAYLVPVTATDPEALARAVGTLSRWVETRGRRQSFRDLSYSLLIGRRLFEHGYVFIARDMEEFSVQLRDALSGTLPPMATLLDGRAPVEGTWELTGTLQAIAPLSDEYLSNLLRIAEQIARGQRTDWRPLYGGELPRRIPVPTYPFAKQRYWIETLPSDQAHVTSKAPEASSVTQAIVGCVSAVLGIDPTIISREQPLSRYGIDSLKALTLKHSLERMLGISVPLQSFLDGSCIRDIAHSLAETRTNSQLQDVSKNSDDRLIERFLNGAFDLRDATDEQLDHLFQRLSETVEVVDAS